MEYLKNPYLVAKIQNFFGVEIEKNEIEQKNEKLENYNGIDATKTNGCVRETTNETNFDEFAKKENLKENVNNFSEKKNFTTNSPPKFSIKNHFWYYLFLFGTELGDEIFYISFIPFWFWNIDGPVGRRVVLVWCIVMSIGEMNFQYFCFAKLDLKRLNNKFNNK